MAIQFLLTRMERESIRLLRDRDYQLTFKEKYRKKGET